MTMSVSKPIDIKGMKLKNRLAFGPILGMPVASDGSVNNETMRWFEDRAKGGVGFIMSGTLEGIHPKDMPKMKAPVRMEVGASIYDDKYVPGWAKLIEMVHSYDVKMGAQLAAPGPMMGEGPSSSPYPDEDSPALGIFDLIAGGIVPVDIVSIERLEAIKGFLASSAAKVKAAGFDCLELHCAHGGANLHASFLSPYYNRRTDQYGGSWENRLRFVIETIDSIRKVVGKDYPLFVRFSVDELLGERGIMLDASVKHIVPALEKAGVDLIDVSQGSVMHSMQGVSISMYYPRGCFISNAEAIKKATKLPVIGVGRIFDIDMAEEVIGQGKADIIYLASQLLSDPETPKKYFEGRQDETRKCIGCKPVLCGTPCTINYESQVSRIPLTAAEKKKKVLVIGGGVGGMEAARIAALRGHKVTLMEKEKELGGMVAALSQIKLMGEFTNIVTYLSTQMKKLGIDVRLGKESTSADVLEMKPDVVIVACGASMTIPENLKGMPGVMDFIHACRNQKAIGQKVVIWGLIAAELAVSLAEEGKDVTIIGSTGVRSLGGPWVIGVRSLDLLKKLTDIPMSRETDFTRRVQNPQVFFGVTVEEITSKEVRIMDNCDDKRVFPYDTLIIARERKKINPLAGQMQGETQVFKIGDCAKLRNIKEAIWAANEVARKI